MRIRAATPADQEAVHALYAEFYEELPPPPYHSDTLEGELREVDAYLADHLVFLAEDEAGPVGLALARRKGPSKGYLSDLYVRPRARRQGVAKALLAEVVGELGVQGADHVTLHVDSTNSLARAVYDRLGFRTRSLQLVAGLAELEGRLGREQRGETFGSVHVQTDDAGAVERAVRQFVPRLGRSAGSIVGAPRNGWTAVYDQLAERDPQLLRRLARELSDRLGTVVLCLGLEDGAVVRFILFEHGRIADEYASVPEYHGALPPGDVVALRANPTVLARLTGADPARVRAVARSAASPAELPPARELLASIAEVLGISGGELAFAEAAELAGAGAVAVAHG